MDSQVDRAKSDLSDGLLTYGGWGDWCPPSGCQSCWNGTAQETSVNSALVSSFYYISSLRIVARYAGILGKLDDQKRYNDLHTQATQTFQNTFYNAASHTYAEPGRKCGEFLSPQTTISLADTLGVIPAEDREAVMDSLVRDIADHGYHLNVGIVGVKYLLPTLSRNGRGDVALMIAQQRTPPSYIYMVEQGATTLWETWTGSRYAPAASWNHIMFGSNSDWYFKYLAGLMQTEESRGWQQLELKPEVWNDARGVSICQNLSSTAASLDTPRGLIRAAWTCGQANTTQVFTYSVQVPVGSRASVTLPGMGHEAVSIGANGGQVWSKGAFVAAVPGVVSGIKSGSAYVFSVGSGSYDFVVNSASNIQHRSRL
eukprot:TRINITY_DN7765_c0_g1_i1.p2 TRINITY_DN7765_c0_g1~~TRINITY_DN7765_c0_g1_i1.p2  ORF type:complete len:371 (+),score=51.51 TRINITY_DN7765_c0_g1_i1:1763-2875(+)